MNNKRKNIYDKLKDCFIGRIDDNDILLIQEGFKKLSKSQKYKFKYISGTPKLIYYQFNKPDTSEINQQWHRVKNAVDNSRTYLFGTNDAYYISHGQGVKYYKFFRYCPKYNMLELVSDYYNKIPLFFHLSDGIYEKSNGIEMIKGIDY